MDPNETSDVYDSVVSTISDIDSNMDSFHRIARDRLKWLGSEAYVKVRLSSLEEALYELEMKSSQVGTIESKCSDTYSELVESCYMDLKTILEDEIFTELPSLCEQVEKPIPQVHTHCDSVRINREGKKMLKKI